jgi:hypothetical protein
MGIERDKDRLLHDGKIIYCRGGCVDTIYLVRTWLGTNYRFPQIARNGMSCGFACRLCIPASMVCMHLGGYREWSGNQILQFDSGENSQSSWLDDSKSAIGYQSAPERERPSPRTARSRVHYRAFFKVVRDKTSTRIRIHRDSPSARLACAAHLQERAYRDHQCLHALSGVIARCPTSSRYMVRL